MRLLGVSDQPDTACRADGPPLVEIMTAATGRSPSSLRYCETEVGRRRRYRGQHGSRDGVWHRLQLDLSDPVTGLAVQVHLESADGVPALRSWTRVRDAGEGLLGRNRAHLRWLDAGHPALWRRPGAAASVSLPLPSCDGRVTTLYPVGSPPRSHSRTGGVRDVRAAGDALAARLFRLTWEVS